MLNDGSSRSAASIVIAGNAAVDLTFIVDEYPGSNDKCSAVAFSRRPGGQGVNMAVAAARLGADCALVSKVGADDDGSFVVSELARHGVRTDGVVREPGGRTPLVSVVVDQSQGTRACVHDKTGMTPLRPDEVDPKLTDGARMVLVDGRFPDACWALASRARGRGTGIVATVERMSEQNRKLSSAADVLIMPTALMRTLHPGVGVLEAGRCVREELGVRALVVTMGAEGSLVLEGAVARELRGFPADVVDSVGAGDAFAAALTLGLAWGWPTATAAAFGNYIGARACEGRDDRWSQLPERPAEEEALAFISHSS